LQHGESVYAAFATPAALAASGRTCEVKIVSYVARLFNNAVFHLGLAEPAGGELLSPDNRRSVVGAVCNRRMRDAIVSHLSTGVRCGERLAVATHGFFEQHSPNELERDQEFQKTEQDDGALRSSRFIVAAPTIEKRFYRHLPSNCGQTSRIDARDKKLCSDSPFGVRCLDATAVSTIHRQRCAEQNASKYPLP
jgi:hypothetical protein